MPASDRVTAGKFVWHDLLTDDVDGAKRFYGDLFGWEFREVNGLEYTLVESGGTPIAGIALHSPRDPADNESQWLSSLSVRNVDQAIHTARQEGGEVLEGPLDLPGRGRFAIIADPQGAVLALLRASGGDPVDAPLPTNAWIWSELWAHDTTESGNFYRALVGYEFKSVVEPSGDEYLLLERDGVPRAGLVPLPWKQIQSSWLSYVRVSSTKQILERTPALGGRIVLGPEATGDDRLAVIADPKGAVLAVQEVGDADSGRAQP